MNIIVFGSYVFSSYSLNIFYEDSVRVVCWFYNNSMFNQICMQHHFKHRLLLHGVFCLLFNMNDALIEWYKLLNQIEYSLNANNFVIYFKSDTFLLLSRLLNSSIKNIDSLYFSSIICVEIQVLLYTFMNRIISQ